jgi:hypothetical protein
MIVTRRVWRDALEAVRGRDRSTVAQGRAHATASANDRDHDSRKRARRQLGTRAFRNKLRVKRQRRLAWWVLVEASCPPVAEETVLSLSPSALSVADVGTDNTSICSAF